MAPTPGLNGQAKDVRALEESYDVAIVGGGIVGTGIARDASLRGLKVLLLEQEDFGYGTTARSSRLVHGGLRYLAHCDFGLVRQDMKERELLLRKAPHLVRPISFLIPVYDSGVFRRLYLRAGLMLYDLLAFGSSLPHNAWMPRNDVLEMEPGLECRELRGAFRYADAQVDMPERLCIENVLDAVAHGARAFNYMRVAKLVRNGNVVAGVEVDDLVGGDRYTVKARVVVNAAGPWAAAVAGDQASLKMLRLSQGSHIVTESLSRNAVVTFSQRDGRLLFIIPWLGQSLVGTTDIEYHGDPAAVRPTLAEVSYLLESAEKLCSAGGSSHPIHYALAGLRALASKGGTSTSNVSRTHKIIVHERQGGPSGLLSVFGGKLTGYRHIAQQVTDEVCALLGHTAHCRTAEEPLPGARDWKRPTSDEVERVARRHGLMQKTVVHLHDLYGSKADDVLALIEQDSGAAKPLYSGSEEVIAQVRYAVIHEGARRVADVLLRRCTSGLLSGQGRAGAPIVAGEMGRLLGWGQDRVDEEVCAYLATLDRDFPAVI